MPTIDGSPEAEASIVRHGMSTRSHPSEPCARATGRFLLGAAAVVLSLTGCGIIGPLGPGDSPTDSTTPVPQTPVASQSPTGIAPSSQGAGYDISCTEAGAVQVRGSVKTSASDAPAADGATLQVVIGWTEAGAAGDGTASLYLQSTRGGSVQTRHEDLHVGDTVDHEDWSVTVASVCDGRVGLDVATA